VNIMLEIMSNEEFGLELCVASYSLEKGIRLELPRNTAKILHYDSRFPGTVLNRVQQCEISGSHGGGYEV
jgi:hypothetical protein